MAKSYKLRNAFGWMPLAAGVAILLGGISGLEDAVRSTAEPQRLTLQELLDGQAGANRHVEITDFQPYDRYVVKVGKDGRPYVGYVGVKPTPPEGGADHPAPPRLLILTPRFIPEQGSFAEWSRRQTISGMLTTDYPHDEQRLRETYAGIDPPSCRCLLEGQKPLPIRETWIYVALGVIGVVLGTWLTTPGLFRIIWKCLHGDKTVRPVSGRK